MHCHMAEAYPRAQALTPTPTRWPHRARQLCFQDCSIRTMLLSGPQAGAPGCARAQGKQHRMMRAGAAGLPFARVRAFSSALCSSLLNRPVHVSPCQPHKASNSSRRTLSLLACAAGHADHGKGCSDHFTITTPLYYVNAGGSSWPRAQHAACCHALHSTEMQPACCTATLETARVQGLGKSTSRGGK